MFEACKSEFGLEAIILCFEERCFGKSELTHRNSELHFATDIQTCLSFCSFGKKVNMNPYEMTTDS